MKPARSVVTLVVLVLAVVASTPGCGGGDDDAPTLMDSGMPERDASGPDAQPDIDAAPVPGCGDGTRSASEACDDGDLVAGDGCSPTCEVEHGFDCTGSPSNCRSTCGDGEVASDEECDDDDTAPLDGCNGSCGVEAGWACTGEPSVCVESCGDGALDPGEQCDDADVDDADGCSSACRIESGWTCSGAPSTCAEICGDGLVVAGEGCDDGNTRGSDGCGATCEIEAGWSCEGAPSVCAAGCGDGVAVGMEQCDDGDATAGDGCSPSCRTETGWACSGMPSACTPVCGDGVVAGGEACDDDDADPGDGCSATCTVERGFECVGAMPSVCASICGDGIVASVESCDDGDLESGDGCDATCATEFAYGCTGEPSACVRIDHAMDVALGDRGGCTLTMNGALRCWGQNARGEAGDGTTLPRFLPVTTMPGSFTQVDFGGQFACALHDDATVWCWGSNAARQQGPGAVGGARPAPGRIGLIETMTMVAVATGQEHACALDEAGDAWCWGDNDNGQLGRGGPDRNDSEAPMMVDLVPAAVAVSAGTDHTCVVHDDGHASCWGDDDQGQLGDGGTNTDQSLPVRVLGLADVVEIAAGGDHTCARLRDGAVRCWGDNQRGQLGIGMMPDQPTPVAVTLPGAATAITAGTWHTCALVDGDAYCWGDGAIGQIGDGSRLSWRTPRAVTTSGATLTAIDAGATGTCAITSAGARVCWGEGDLAQLGLLAPSQREPAAVSIDASMVATIAGTRPRRHAVWCAASSADGALSCWGNSETGLVLDALASDALVPRAAVAIEDVVELGMGESFACARLDGGAVRCWGDNSQRQLGQGMSVVDSASPVSVMALPAGQAQIAVGGEFACARDAGGVVRCWGDSAQRQVGFDALTDSGVATPIAGAESAIAIAAGELHACAIVNASSGAGTVRCWGADDQGQHGDGSPGGARHTALDVPELGPATQLALGRAHTCALLLSGRVSCWGDNALGQVGDGGTADRFAPREVVGLTDVAQIAAGWDHTCARRTDGSVWCWGAAADGQLGAAASTPFATMPVQLEGVSGALDVAGTATSTCVRDAGGVRCVGFHGFAQLGAGLTLRPLVPTGAPL
ncbi:Hypothetical protein I5071_70220 [Sandaracinus amylolyticus]|nr:Hypothetical protein I5071_70220 [Sandaracinus amylolyticus]